MKYFLILLFTFSTSTLFAEVTMGKAISRPSLPVEKPEHPIVRPPHGLPIVNTGVVYQDNYYNPYTGTSCQSYIDQITALNNEIVDLKTEVARLQAIEDARLQKTLKAKHQKEMDAFNNRKSSVKTTNSIEIKTK